MKSLRLTSVAFSLWVMCQPFSLVQAANTTVDITDSQMRPAALSATKDEPLALEIVNRGQKMHNFVIPDFYIFTQNLKPGETVHVQFTPDKTGKFPYYSDTGGNPEPGIRGSLAVR